MAFFFSRWIRDALFPVVLFLLLSLDSLFVYRWCLLLLLLDYLQVSWTEILLGFLVPFVSLNIIFFVFFSLARAIFECDGVCARYYFKWKHECGEKNFFHCENRDNAGDYKNNNATPKKWKEKDDEEKKNRGKKEKECINLFPNTQTHTHSRQPTTKMTTPTSHNNAYFVYSQIILRESTNTLSPSNFFLFFSFIPFSRPFIHSFFPLFLLSPLFLCTTQFSLSFISIQCFEEGEKTHIHTRAKAIPTLQQHTYIHNARTFLLLWQWNFIFRKRYDDKTKKAILYIHKVLLAYTHTNLHSLCHSNVRAQRKREKKKKRKREIEKQTITFVTNFNNVFFFLSVLSGYTCHKPLLPFNRVPLRMFIFISIK